MGTVFSARDPKLEREVALKILHRSHGLSRQMVQTEARALAKLSHPNVVTLYDADFAEDRLYLAMEYIHGQSLNLWLDSEPRRVADVVRVLLDACRGISAAHQAGVTHGDIKPQNILVDQHGRAHIVDFGLSRLTARAAKPQAEITGGTPGYLAPELLTGALADAASDQYALCTTFRRAFLHPKVRGRLPRWLRAVLNKGCEPTRTKRFASIAHIIQRLETVPKRRKRWIAGLGTVAALGLGIVIARTPVEDACTLAAGRLHSVWNDDSRTQMRAHLAALPHPAARSTAIRVVDRFDEYAKQWQDTHVNACDRGPNADDASLFVPAIAAARMRCLDRSLAALKARLELIGEAKNDVLRYAVQTVEGLPSLEACSEPLRLQSPWMQGEHERTAEFDRRYAQTKALLDMRETNEAKKHVDALFEDAQEIDDTPVQARTLVLRAEIADALGLYGDAAEDLRQALHLAASQEDDYLTAEIWPELLFAVGMDPADETDVAAWEAFAKLAFVRVGDPQKLHQRLRHNLAALYKNRGEHERAIALNQANLDDAELSPLGRANAMANVCNSWMQLERVQETLDTCTDAYELFELELGREHPKTALIAVMAAVAHGWRSQHAQAEELFSWALPMLHTGLSPDDPWLDAVENFHALWLRNAGRFGEAIAALRSTVQRLEDAHGPDDPRRLAAYINLAEILHQENDFEEAARIGQQAVALAERAGGGQDLALALVNLANTRMELGSWDQAEELLSTVISMDEGTADTRMSAFAHAIMGEMYRRRDLPARALPYLEQATTLNQEAGLPWNIADAKFALGACLWDLGKTDRGRRVVDEARALLEDLVLAQDSAPSGWHAQLESIGDWLATHTS